MERKMGIGLEHTECDGTPLSLEGRLLDLQNQLKSLEFRFDQHVGVTESRVLRECYEKYGNSTSTNDGRNAEQLTFERIAKVREMAKATEGYWTAPGGWHQPTKHPPVIMPGPDHAEILRLDRLVMNRERIEVGYNEGRFTVILYCCDVPMASGVGNTIHEAFTDLVIRTKSWTLDSMRSAVGTNKPAGS